MADRIQRLPRTINLHPEIVVVISVSGLTD